MRKTFKIITIIIVGILSISLIFQPEAGGLIGAINYVLLMLYVLVDLMFCVY